MMIRSPKNADFQLIRHRIKTINQRRKSSIRSTTNPNKVRLTLDPKQQNPVYSIMKQERTTKSVLDYILGSTLGNNSAASKRRSQSEKFILEKTHSPNFRAFSKQQNFNTQKDVETLRMKGENIFIKADNFQTDLRKKKERLRILDKYNNKVDQYCSFIPKTYQQNEKEILIAHDEIRKLCKEQFFKKEESLMDRASSILQYSEPIVKFKQYKKSKYAKQRRHKRIATAPLEDTRTVSFKRHTLE